MMDMFEETIELEKHGQIEPLNDQFRFLLRSFMNFIQSGFKSRIKEKKQEGNLWRKQYVYGKDIFNRMKNSKKHFPFYEIIHNLLADYEKRSLLFPRLSGGNQLRLSYSYKLGGKDVAIIIFFIAKGIKLLLPKDHFPEGFNLLEWKGEGPANWLKGKKIETEEELKELQEVILDSIGGSLRNRN